MWMKGSLNRYFNQNSNLVKNKGEAELLNSLINSYETIKRQNAIQTSTNMLDNKSKAPCEKVDLKKVKPFLNKLTLEKDKVASFFNDEHIMPELYLYEKIYFHDRFCYTHYVIHNISGNQNKEIAVNISIL